MTDKKRVHDYLVKREIERRDHKPVPSAEQIKREMGWALTDAARASADRERMRGR